MVIKFPEENESFFLLQETKMLNQFSKYSLMVIFSVIIQIFSYKSEAQTIFNDFGHDKTISIEFLKPAIDYPFMGVVNTSFLTSAIYLSAHLPLGGNIFFVGELPFALASVEYFNNNPGRFIINREKSGNTIGDPYLGLELRGNNESGLVGEFGLRIPLASDESIASPVGILTDFVDRAEAFASNALSINALVNYIHKDTPGLFYRIRGGPLLRLRTAITASDNELVELLLLYGTMVGYNGKKVRFLGGVNGRFLLSEGGSFGERTAHQSGVSVNFGAGSVRPGFNIRIPLDKEYSEILNFAIGIDLVFILP
jgi:hypothetical protein